MKEFKINLIKIKNNPTKMSVKSGILKILKTILRGSKNAENKMINLLETSVRCDLIRVDKYVIC